MSNGYKEYASNNVATTSASGLISVIDKVKLDGIEAQANNYVHPDTHPATMIEGLADYMATLGYGKCAAGSYVGDGTGTLNFEAIGNHKVTYTGTTPRKITFPFNPNVVLLVEKESGEMYVIRNGEPTTKIYVTARVSKSGSNSYRLYCSPEVNFALLSDNELQLVQTTAGTFISNGTGYNTLDSITMYSDSDRNNQLTPLYNKAGYTYYYLAF